MAKENSGIMKKVVKFGGSSLASAEQFKKVGAIIKSDESRVYVVPSAPGKRFSDDTKVTDMLLHVYETAKAGNDFTEEVKAIKARYDEIIIGLEIKDFSLDKDFEEITKQLEDLTNPDPMCTLDYVASRGEFLNGKIMAAYLDFEFIDAAEVIFSMQRAISIAIRRRRYLVRDLPRHSMRLFQDSMDLARMAR